MTPADKRDRRQARHEAQYEAKRLINGRIGLFSTPLQVKAAARKLADRYVAQITNSRPYA